MRESLSIVVELLLAGVVPVARAAMTACGSTSRSTAACSPPWRTLEPARWRCAPRAAEPVAPTTPTVSPSGAWAPTARGVGAAMWA
jgi:hypothetical protein